MIEQEISENLLEQLSARELAERFGLSEREVRVLRKRFGINEKPNDNSLDPIPPKSAGDD